VTGSSSEGFRWRDVGDRFEFERFSLERCGRQVQVRTVFVREMWTTRSDQDS
jgi:hypothetical protein